MINILWPDHDIGPLSKHMLAQRAWIPYFLNFTTLKATEKFINHNIPSTFPVLLWHQDTTFDMRVNYQSNFPFLQQNSLCHWFLNSCNAILQKWNLLNYSSTCMTPLSVGVPLNAIYSSIHLPNFFTELYPNLTNGRDDILLRGSEGMLPTPRRMLFLVFFSVINFN